MASDTQTILPRSASTLPGYSAVVRIELNIDGRRLFPTHTAPDFLIFREPPMLAPSVGRLLVSVDGQAQESTIEILPHASPTTRIPIRRAPGI